MIHDFHDFHNDFFGIYFFFFVTNFLPLFACPLGWAFSLGWDFLGSRSFLVLVLLLQKVWQMCHGREIQHQGSLRPTAA